MSALSDAIDRLQNLYNDGIYDVVGNPYGFDGNGHRQNFLKALRDIATAGAALAGQLNVTSTANRTGASGAAATVLNAEIAALIAAGGGRYFLPPGIFDVTGSRCNIDRSGVATRFQGCLIIEGSGAATVIRNTTGSACKILNAAANSETYLEMRNLRFLGNTSSIPAASKGLEIEKFAYGSIRGVSVEGFETGIYGTDIEQTLFDSCWAKFNTDGGNLAGPISVTAANAITILACAFANNVRSGLNITQGNSVLIKGGQFNNNGATLGNAAHAGLVINESGSGGAQGKIDIDTFFEGNIGAADLVINQSSGTATINVSSTFLRVGASYATNNVQFNGSSACRLNLAGSKFGFAGGYTESAGRKNVAINNANVIVTDIGSEYQSTTALEAPNWKGTTTLGNAISLGGNGQLGCPVGVMARLQYVTSGDTLYAAGNFSLGSGVVLGAIDSTFSSLRPLQLRVSQLLVDGPVAVPALTVNGAAPGVLTFRSTAVNFNSANTDTIIPIVLPTGWTRYFIAGVRISGSTGDLSSSTFGVFTAAAAGGVAVVTSGTANTITSASDATNNNSMTVFPNNANTETYTAANLYFRVQTPQGAARTANVIIEIRPAS